MLLAEVAPDEHGHAHGKLRDNESDEVEDLAAGGYAGQARRGAKMPDDEQIDRAVGGLQDQRTQNGQHEQGQLVQDIPLGKIRFIAYQRCFSFRLRPDTASRWCGSCRRHPPPGCPARQVKARKSTVYRTYPTAGGPLRWR